MKTCIVRNCENTDDPDTGGQFIGDLCYPCHEYITAGIGIYSQAYRNAHSTTVVKLQYFKHSGKYYSSGEYESSHHMLYDVVKEVRKMQSDGKLPGLVSGATEFVILIEGEVPHIIPPAHFDYRASDITKGIL